jgi:hypothetical protein
VRPRLWLRSVSTLHPICRYLKNAAALKLATGPYKVIPCALSCTFRMLLYIAALLSFCCPPPSPRPTLLQAARDAYVAATATYTKNLYE